MHLGLGAAATSLDQLGRGVVQQWNDDRTLRDVFGWNHAAVTRHELGAMAFRLAERIRAVIKQPVPGALEPFIGDVPRRVQLLLSETVPQMYTGNGVYAVPAYIATLDSIRDSLDPVLQWEQVADPKRLPGVVARRVRQVEQDVDSVVAKSKDLKQKIDLIQDGHRAAVALPNDLEALKKAKSQFDLAGSEAAAAVSRISEKTSEADRLLAALMNQEKEAGKLVAQCSEAYRVTTTIGLAASFDQRARSLSASMWIWVAGLLIALTTGAAIGSQRVSFLTEALKGDEPQWGVIVIHAILSIVSVGAPLWFAWLATKQIGQRFRLAEDYGFKASVAKAYEGYRREAARIDIAFEARLFSSALSRLEEAPLRLVEETSHGSPWHELISSEAFRSAMDNVPSLREKFVSIAKRGSSTAEADDGQPASVARVSEAHPG